MKRMLFAMVVVLILTASVTRAQTLRNAASSAPPGTVAARGGGPASASRPDGAMVMALFDRNIVKGFNEVWRCAAGGVLSFEAVVLIIRNADGSGKAILPHNTNEYRRFTFRWQPGIIAIVHTHPSDSDPKPGDADIDIAERFHVPIFTLTKRGMFLYDPTTKVISKVQERLDWLTYSKWTRYAPVMAAPLATRQ